MKITFHILKNNLKTGTLFGVLAVAPLLTNVLTAQAAPDHHRRPWGDRNRPTVRPIKRTVTVTGTVNSVNRNSFTLRTGRSFLSVTTASRTPRTLSRGDLVQVTGRQTGSSFRATSVHILRNR